MDNKLQTKQIIVNGLVINYYCYQSSQKNNKTLVFLHGWGVDSRSWQPIVSPLINQNYSVYLIDLPGFGQSQQPDEHFSLDNYADVVDQLITKVGLNNIVLVGHSFGGRITIKLGSKHAPYLKKIILVDSAGIEKKSQSIKLKMLIAKILKPFFQPKTMQGLRKKIYSLIGAGEYLAIPELSKIFGTVTGEDLTPILNKINQPTLIIWGDKDQTTPQKAAQIVNSEIKGSQLAIINNAGHFSFLDQPQKFINIIMKFI